MSSAPARPGPRARHGAGRVRAPTVPFLREEDLPQAHVLPPLLGSALGRLRAGLRLRRYAPRMRPARVDTGERADPRDHVMQPAPGLDPGSRRRDGWTWPRPAPPHHARCTPMAMPESNSLALENSRTLEADRLTTAFPCGLA